MLLIIFYFVTALYWATLVISRLLKKNIISKEKELPYFMIVVGITILVKIISVIIK